MLTVSYIARVCTHTCKPQVLSQDTVISRGYDRLQTTLDHACSLSDDCSYRVANPSGLGSARVVGTSVRPHDLNKYLSKRMTKRVDKQWSVSSKSEQVAASANGDYVVSGLQLGNVLIGVQPLLGLEGIYIILQVHYSCSYNLFILCANDWYSNVYTACTQRVSICSKFSALQSCLSYTNKQSDAVLCMLLFYAYHTTLIR
jgi:hypothetical protein